MLELFLSFPWTIYIPNLFNFEKLGRSITFGHKTISRKAKIAVGFFKFPSLAEFYGSFQNDFLRKSICTNFNNTQLNLQIIAFYVKLSEEITIFYCSKLLNHTKIVKKSIISQKILLIKSRPIILSLLRLSLRPGRGHGWRGRSHYWPCRWARVIKGMVAKGCVIRSWMFRIQWPQRI